MMEREIKLRFDNAEVARAAVAAAGATPLRGRRLQEDCLLDTDDELLRRQRSVLRIRMEAGKSLLTFKGPVQPSLMKLREELETENRTGRTGCILAGTWDLNGNPGLRPRCREGGSFTCVACF